MLSLVLRLTQRVLGVKINGTHGRQRSLIHTSKRVLTIGTGLLPLKLANWFLIIFHDHIFLVTLFELLADGIFLGSTLVVPRQFVLRSCLIVAWRLSMFLETILHLGHTPNCHEASLRTLNTVSTHRHLVSG